MIFDHYESVFRADGPEDVPRKPAATHTVGTILNTANAKPTPPASQPTVTRTRDEELDELATYIALRLPEHLLLHGDRAEAKRVLLALLRAAEQRKVKPSPAKEQTK